MTYLPPRLIASSDVVDDFQCRSSEQTLWLQRHAKQSAAANSTTVFVVTESNSANVATYYAWRMAEVGLSDAPPRITRGVGRYPQPVALLARLGVDERHEGHGLGAGMLRDAVSRMVLIGHEIGCRGLLIHAENDDARNFYLHLVPELEPSPTDSLHLVLLTKDARRTLELP